jgi:hypothetical protein
MSLQTSTGAEINLQHVRIQVVLVGEYIGVHVHQVFYNTTGAKRKCWYHLPQDDGRIITSFSCSLGVDTVFSEHGNASIFPCYLGRLRTTCHVDVTYLTTLREQHRIVIPSVFASVTSPYAGNVHIDPSGAIYYCNGCQQLPLTGVRYHCTECKDYDICLLCNEQRLHGTTHRLVAYNGEGRVSCSTPPAQADTPPLRIDIIVEGGAAAEVLSESHHVIDEVVMPEHDRLAIRLEDWRKGRLETDVVLRVDSNTTPPTDHPIVGLFQVMAEIKRMEEEGGQDEEIVKLSIAQQVPSAKTALIVFRV